MGALTAVKPHGLGVVDHDGEDGNLALGFAGSCGLETGKDALLGGVAHCDGDARVVKSRLGDGMVASPELELHHGSCLSLDLLGPVLEAGLLVHGVLADSNDLNIDSCDVLLVSVFLIALKRKDSGLLGSDRTGRSPTLRKGSGRHTLSNTGQSGESKRSEMHLEMKYWEYPKT